MSGAVVGVDIGTGGARAVALDHKGAVLGTASAGYPGEGSWAAGRADAWAWRAACLEALAALAASVDAAGQPVAVAVGGQSPATVANDGGLAVTVRHPAGNDLDNASRQYAQRALIEAERGRAIAPRQLWDWVLESLGAEAVQGRWPGDLTLVDFGRRCTTGDVVGYASGDTGLPAGTPLVTGAQDAYLAFWAAGMDAVGRAVDPGGRTGGLAVAVPDRLRVEGLWTFSSAARGVSIAGGAVNAHGIAIEWLSSLLDRSIDELLELAADAPPGARGVSFLPYLEGERAPRWDSRLRGLVAGLDSATTAAELTRAILEGTACGLAHIAGDLRAAGARINVLVCAGTPARSELWCAIKGAVVGVEVEVPVDLDLAAYGAALAAGAGAGWWPRPGAGDPGDWPRPPMRRVPPLPDAAPYGDILRRFIAAGDIIQQNLATFGTNADCTTDTPISAKADVTQPATRD